VQQVGAEIALGCRDGQDGCGHLIRVLSLRSIRRSEHGKRGPPAAGGLRCRRSREGGGPGLGACSAARRSRSACCPVSAQESMHPGSGGGALSWRS
jgi:hypothetical protein